jgi:5-formyltetrahydrofolate cyclo-ligase
MSRLRGHRSGVTKDAIRRHMWDILAAEHLSVEPYGRIPPFEGQNRAAERLRRWPQYRGARCLMVVPDEALLQVRANAIGDGKRLIVATPNLKDGFYLLDARGIPSGRWMRAVRPSGVQEHGRRLTTSRDAVGTIDLLITGAVAVDLRGGRIGKGRGFFDLEYGILRQIGCIGPETPVVGVVHDSQILDRVPTEEGDVSLDWIVTPERILPCQGGEPKPEGIPWGRLTDREIRQMRPLQELRGGSPRG